MAGEPPGGDPLVDIKELLRTYVIINDPDVREVTTKFGAAFLVMGVAALSVWGLLAITDDGDVARDPAAGAEDGDASEEPGEDDGDAPSNESCIEEEDLPDGVEEPEVCLPDGADL